MTRVRSKVARTFNRTNLINESPLDSFSIQPGHEGNQTITMTDFYGRRSAYIRFDGTPFAVTLPIGDVEVVEMVDTTEGGPIL